MAATFSWKEDNGVATGSPSAGTTRTDNRTEINWKNIDDSTTAYSSSPITGGNNSFTKYQYGHFTGAFNQISSGKVSLNTTIAGAAGSALATGLTLHGKVTSTYTTPATTADSGISSPTDYTAGGPAVGSGAAINFATSGPENASPTATLSAAGYSQYFASQLQTTSSAAAGDTATLYMAMQYNEN